VPEFLSPEWLSALDDAARASDGLAQTGREGTFVVEQRVTGVPNGEISYHARVDFAGGRVTPGRAETPDIILVTDYETALAIHRGETNAQRAIASGRMKLRGHVEVLLRRLDTLTALAEAVRATRTDHAPTT
jgi:hypothetical protein